MGKSLMPRTIPTMVGLVLLVASAAAYTPRVPAFSCIHRTGSSMRPLAVRSTPPIASATVVASALVAAPSQPVQKAMLLASTVSVLVLWLVRVLNTPSRVYDRAANSVGGKDFIQAKYDFIDRMLDFSKAAAPKNVLDVGCGIGGTSRYLAKKFPQASVTGITISPEQQGRASSLAAERGIANAKFELVDALKMKFADNSFDFVWACESGEHMPDKEKYVQEMVRVLKPGGRIVIATWCQREEPPEFTPSERNTLDYLYGEWTHPYFISIDEYARIMQRTGALEQIVTDDWAAQTIPAWRHSVWVGVWDPWPVIRRPHLWWKTIRDAWCLEVMHRAFTGGLMEYGMMTAQKKLA